MNQAKPLNIRYRDPLTTMEQLRYAIEAAISAAAPQRVEVLPAGVKLATDLNSGSTTAAAAPQRVEVLPPGEELAIDLKIGRTTVFGAYQLLSEANLVDANGRAGTVINRAWEDRADITAAADELARLAHGNGVELHYLLALLAQLWPDPTEKERKAAEMMRIEAERNAAEKVRIETERNADVELFFEDDPSASLAELNDFHFS